MAALSPGQRRALTVARRGYVVVLVAVVVWILATRGEEVLDVVRSAQPVFLLACLLASFGQLALTSLIWTTGLRALGADVAWTTSLRATASATPARYLPGSVWYAVGRSVTLQQAGVRPRALAVVATLETLLIPVVGFALGAALLALTGAGLGGVPAVPLLAVSLVLLALVSPPAVNAALRFRAKGEPPRLSWPRLARFTAATVLFWAWSAAVFALYVRAFPEASDAGVFAVAGAYMVAWGVGWLAIFAPQGAGVFEAMLAALLADGAAAGLALVLGGYRAVILLRDLAAAGLAALVGVRAPRPALVDPSAPTQSVEGPPAPRLQDQDGA